MIFSWLLQFSKNAESHSCPRNDGVICNFDVDFVQTWGLCNHRMVVAIGS